MAVHPESYISTFSGIGALDLAIGRVFPASRCLAYVEGEAYAAAVLAARMETGDLDDAPIWSDIRTFPTGALRGRVGLVVGGFPCQDLSLAGKRAGIDGARSGLFFDLIRIVRDVRPRYVFLENVAAITAGRTLDAVLGALADVGFDAEWGCLRASDVGAPHRRDRWFCLAWDRELVYAEGISRANGTGLADGGRPLVSPQSRADGRAGERETAEGVPFHRRIDATGSTHLREQLADAQQSDADGRRERLPDTGVSGALAAQTGQSPRSGSRYDLANAEHGGLSRRPQPNGRTHGPRLEAPRRCDALGCAQDVGDAERQGLAFGRSVGRDDGEERPTAERSGIALADATDSRWRAGLGCNGARQPDTRRRVPYPPGPADRAGWAAYLDAYPDLAPAVESKICGGADRGSDQLDMRVQCTCNRIDRLRGLGNAVVPDCAEMALRLLWRRSFGEWP